MIEQKDGWTEMGRQTDTEMDKQTDGWTKMGEQTDCWTDKWLNRQMVGQTDG